MFLKRGVEKLCHSKAQRIKPQLLSVPKKKEKKKKLCKKPQSGTEKNKTTADQYVQIKSTS